MISLERRTEKRQRMFVCLDQLQLDFRLFDALWKVSELVIT